MKVSLTTMIVMQEQEVDRIDTWERVLKSEGKQLDVTMEQRRWIARRTQQTLELLLKHEAEFRRMVEAHQQAAARAAAIRSSFGQGDEKEKEAASASVPPGASSDR